MIKYTKQDMGTALAQARRHPVSQILRCLVRSNRRYDLIVPHRSPVAGSLAALQLNHSAYPDRTVFWVR